MLLLVVFMELIQELDYGWEDSEPRMREESYDYSNKLVPFLSPHFAPKVQLLGPLGSRLYQLFLAFPPTFRLGDIYNCLEVGIVEGRQDRENCLVRVPMARDLMPLVSSYCKGAGPSTSHIF